VVAGDDAGGDVLCGANIADADREWSGCGGNIGIRSGGNGSTDDRTARRWSDGESDAGLFRAARAGDDDNGFGQEWSGASGAEALDTWKE
jgi:hypothetical protein